jgi:hypothetical protein
MELYRYRSIKSAKRDIRDGTFHFSSRDELNDPLEGYISLYWQGDKQAWEGLFKNYICSLHNAIGMYLLAADESVLWKRTLLKNPCAFDGLPVSELYTSLGIELLNNKEIERITSLYGNNEYKCSLEEFHHILQLVHGIAFPLCISNHVAKGCIPQEEVDRLFLDRAFSKKMCQELDLIEKLNNDSLRKKIIGVADNLLGELKESLMIRVGLNKNGFAYGNKKAISNKKHRQIRNWIALQIEYPQMYINQLRDMIYPDAFVVCFSGKNNDSAMWGNYADNHRGVCFIYEAFENNTNPLAGGIYDRKDQMIKARKVEYGGDKFERNFFESLGRLPLYPIRAWLTGKDGKTSKVVEAYNGNNEKSDWRIDYWENFKAKNYRKLKEWSHEDEYRINIDNSFFNYVEEDSIGEKGTEGVNRNIEYDLSLLKGIIFGIRTTEYDKVMIVKTLIKKRIADKVKFYQAYFDEENQRIEIRPKVLRLDDKNVVVY